MNKSLFWLGSVLAVAIGAVIFWIAKDDERMRTQLTIYLGGEVLREGGTVIVLPTPVAEEVLKYKPEDSHGTMRKLSVDVTEPFSIVFFNYPEEGAWTYRFGTKSPDPEAQKVTTLRVAFGSGGYLDPETNQMVELPHVETLMVSGPNASESKSRLHDVNLTTILRTRAMSCQDYEDARVCVPQ